MDKSSYTMRDCCEGVKGEDFDFITLGLSLAHSSGVAFVDGEILETAVFIEHLANMTQNQSTAFANEVCWPNL